MPLAGGRYRVTTKGGKKIRLHFGAGGKVDEAKNLKTGKTHTPAEFAKDKSLASRLSRLRTKGAFKKGKKVS